MENNMKTFYEAIYEWVKDNFGQSEADDPSWNLEQDTDQFFGRDHIESYIKHDLRLVAGGGYDTDTIKNTKIVLTWGV